MLVDDIRRAYTGLSASEQRVADYVLEHPHEVTTLSMAELSKKTDTSDATVMRMCRSVGQKGFYQLKINLAMDSALITEEAEEGGSVATLVSRMTTRLSDLPRFVTDEQVKEVIRLLKESEHVFCFGWGNANIVAQDLAHRLLSFGVHTFSTDNVEFIMRSLALAQPGDSLVLVSHTGESVIANDCASLAKARGVRVILITASLSTGLSKTSDVTLATGYQDPLMDAWGHTSYLSELMVVDLLLYHLRDESPEYQLGKESEAVLAQFKR